MGAISSENMHPLAVYKGNPGRGGTRPRPTKTAQESGNVEPYKCCEGKHPSKERKFKKCYLLWVLPNRTSSFSVQICKS